MNYRALVLAIDPKAKIEGPFRVGHYSNYTVRDGAGKEIGWTEGNERGTQNAWARAYGTLMNRKKSDESAQQKSAGDPSSS